MAFAKKVLASFCLVLLIFKVDCEDLENASKAGGQTDVASAVDDTGNHQERFLIGSSNGGKFTNQMLNLWALLALSRYLNRTVVLADMIQYHRDTNWDDRGWFPPTKFFTRESIAACAGGRLVDRSSDTEAVDFVGCIDFQLMPSSTRQRTAMNNPCDDNTLLQWDQMKFKVAESRVLNWDSFMDPDIQRRRVIGVGRFAMFLLYQYNLRHMFHGPPGCLKQDFEPVDRLTQVAERYVANVLGGQGAFLSAHWRRGDFLELYNKDPMAFANVTSTVVVGKLIAAHLQTNHLTTIYVATTATPEDRSVVQTILSAAGFSMFTLDDLLAGPPEALDGLDLEDAYEKAVVDKWICSWAKVFKWTPESTFSQNISHIRKNRGRRHPNDGRLFRPPKKLWGGARK